MQIVLFIYNNHVGYADAWPPSNYIFVDVIRRQICVDAKRVRL